MREPEENEFNSDSFPNGRGTEEMDGQMPDGAERELDDGIYQEDDFGSDAFDDKEELEEKDLFASLNKSLMEQVARELDVEDSEPKAVKSGTISTMRKKQNKILIIIGSIFSSLILIIGFFAGTLPGRRAVYWLAGRFLHSYMGRPEQIDPPDNSEENPLTPGAPTLGADEEPVTPIPIPEDHFVRKEDYVKNFLVFGIEQIDGANNTDTMMIATINTKDKTVRLTSILRDLYVELGDGIGRKLNSVYARGRRDGQGPELLMGVIENVFKIDLEGYAYVNFNSFEKIVDLLGGVTIELGATEAKYLNTTNYISNPAYRNVKAGVNRMNGNQVVGYCRVRKVPTIGGANNDYGRTLRQRRVLTAIFNEYKSKNFFELMPITTKCLSYITTNLSADQISELLELVLENGITTIESTRVPVENSFYDSGKKGHNGVTYGLVMNDPAANIKFLFQFLYGDTEEEAENNYNALD